jgi:hypothetical protein
MLEKSENKQRQIQWSCHGNCHGACGRTFVRDHDVKGGHSDNSFVPGEFMLLCVAIFWI